MDDQLNDVDEDRRESGACWAVPGAMLLTLLVMFVFLSQFVHADEAITTHGAEAVAVR